MTNELSSHRAVAQGTNGTIWSRSLPWLASALALGYCGGQAADLIATWRGNSGEALGGVLFALWLVPLLRKSVASQEQFTRSAQLAWLATAVVLAFVGQVTWLNCVQHAALALAVVHVRRDLPGRWLWFVSSVIWMPACGWLMKGLPTSAGLALRAGMLLAIDVYMLNASQRRWSLAYTAGLLLLVGVSAKAHAEEMEYSPVQSPARPYGLDVVDKVVKAGGDEQSKEFLKQELPAMQKLIDENLHEKTDAFVLKGASNGLIALDTTKLTLAVSSEVRAYFVGEGAGYHNSLGFNTKGYGVESGNPLLVFPDASSSVSYLSSGSGKRTTSEPLFPGDFVQLGKYDAGTQFDFFLISNGASGGKDVFSTNHELNQDKLDHVVAFAQVDNPYVLIGFEDLFGGGDNDYNDLLFAVYFGGENVNSLIKSSALSGVPAPEPGFLWAIVAGCGTWLYRRRRNKVSQQER